MDSPWKWSRMDEGLESLNDSAVFASNFGGGLMWMRDYSSAQRMITS